MAPIVEKQTNKNGQSCFLYDYSTRGVDRVLRGAPHPMYMDSINCTLWVIKKKEEKRKK